MSDPLFPWEEIRLRYAPSPLWGAPARARGRSVSGLEARLARLPRAESHPPHPQLGGIASGVSTEEREMEAAADFLRSVLQTTTIEATGIEASEETTNPGLRMSTYHQPVLPHEVLHALAPADGGVYVDATLGGGGHSELILAGTSDTRVIGIDQDQDALREATARLSRFGDRFVPVHGNFEHLASLLAGAGIESADGILMDLGVSSHHFDTAERGFSFSDVGPLDMRMNKEDEATAADLVNTLPQAELARILRELGEEPMAARIAAEILRRRSTTPLHTTKDLVDVVLHVYGNRAKASRKHPATKTFQALRIAVNRELDVLSAGLEAAFRCLQPGGRLVVISFHSLEDRIVKRFMKNLTLRNEPPPEVPVTDDQIAPAPARLMTRKPITASDAEIEENPRARSAKLRALEKTEEETDSGDPA